MHTIPPLILVFPFIGLLLMIATGPIFFQKLWHHHYPKISVGLGVIVFLYYGFVMDNFLHPLETIAEYISFISLLVILFVASGGIYVFIDVESKPLTNIVFLFIAAILTNLVGTTGASVLLIRPFMRINRYRLQPYHIVFFIFIVSNLGGLLTPIGDPPLFMGYLKGVPFEYTFIHLFPKWIVAIAGILLVFFLVDRKNTKLDEVDSNIHYTNKVLINGKRNFIWLLIGIASIFIDPNLIDALPHIDIAGKKISFIREIIQLSAAFFCFKLSDKNALLSNDFSFEPIKEVAWLFIGIFLTMIPALQWLEHLAQDPAISNKISASVAYWFSGVFSSVLDNAPTYLNVFAVVLAKFGFSIESVESVRAFLKTEHINYLSALSTGAVFFGAMTYIGNGPNFMVKSIADQAGVKMPSFGTYIFKYSIPYLLPVLVLVWLLFYC
ncbi:MAG: sodium:proton antiporter [Bacteroidota bacterium]